MSMLVTFLFACVAVVVSYIVGYCIGKEDKEMDELERGEKWR